MRTSGIRWRAVVGFFFLIAALGVGGALAAGFGTAAAGLYGVAGMLGLFLFLAALRSLSRAHARLEMLSRMNVEVNRALLLNEDIASIYQTILDYLFGIFVHANQGSILVLDEEGFLTIASSRGFSDDFVRSFRLPLEESFLYRECGGAIAGARLISKKTLEHAIVPEGADTWRFQSVVSAPLFMDGSLYGLLNLDSVKKKTFTREDVAVMEHFTAQIEVCLMARGKYRANIEHERKDSLTGLFTRRYFEELFAIEAARSERYGESFILALFDADNLKKINDTLGHQAGDRLLLAISDALKTAHRKTDILCRFGGDEFIAVYHSSEIKDMRKILAAVLAGLRSHPIEHDGAYFIASFSYGLACFPEDGATLDALITVADKHLYAMKRKKK